MTPADQTEAPQNAPSGLPIRARYVVTIDAAGNPFVEGPLGNLIQAAGALWLGLCAVEELAKSRARAALAAQSQHQTAAGSIVPAPAGFNPRPPGRQGRRGK